MYCVIYKKKENILPLASKIVFHKSDYCKCCFLGISIGFVLDLCT